MIKQLAKTTPYLTGNQKLDIILERGNDGIEYLTDKYINISTTTNSIPYPIEINKSIYNYSYAENLRQFYQQTKDYFYKDMSNFESKYALYYDYKVDAYDHTYQCGLKRAEYGIYNKQYHFFCPIFITDSTDIDLLSFRISVRGEAVDAESRTHIQPDQENMVKEIRLSDVLKGYLKTYLKDVDDNILNLFISQNYGNISGLNVETGINKVVDISYIFSELQNRETTLIEFDNHIIKTFEQNKMIARQLINLDFFFSPSDLFAKTIIHNLEWKRWNIYIDVLYNGQKVDYVDIYSNFNRIPKCIISEGEVWFDESKNVLDYLHDNRDISNITVNKISQPICHWSIFENPSYIYNLYNGFSPILRYTGENNVQIETEASGYFFNQCNPYHLAYSNNINNLSWCNVYHLDVDNSNSINTINQFIRDESRYTYIDLRNSSDNVLWINNNKFNLNNIDVFAPVYIMCIIVPPNCDNICFGPPSVSSCGFYIGLYDNNKIIFVIQDKPEYLNNMAFFNIINRSWTDLFRLNTSYPMYEHDPDCTSILYQIETLFKRYEPYNKVIFNKSIIPVHKSVPFCVNDEITYIKTDTSYQEMYRYEGKLIPTFIDVTKDYNYFNEDWRMKIFIGDGIESPELKKYASMANKLKSAPLYPSLGYFPMESSKSVYFSFPEYYEDYLGDIEWQKASLLYFLPETLEYEFIENRYTTVDDGYLMDFLCTQIPVVPSVLIYYIYKLYQYQLDFEYASIDNVDYIRYKVKFILR